MRNWSTSAKVTAALALLLLFAALARQANYQRLARTIAYHTATPQAVDAARRLVRGERLFRVFRAQADQAKLQALWTTQVLATDLTPLVRDGRRTTMARLAAAAVIEFLGDKELPVRAAATEALGRMGHAAAGPLVDEGLASPSKDVRSNAAVALTAIGAVAVPDLLRALDSGGAPAKVAAARVLGQLHSERAVPALIGALSAAQEEVRVAARDALVTIGRDATAPLVEALAADEALTRQHAAEALGELGDGAAVQPLLVALADKERQVRLAATYALGKLSGPAAVPALLAELGNSDRDLREAAAVALGQLRDPRAAGPLVALLQDAVEPVRQAAGMALGRLAPWPPEVLAQVAAVAAAPRPGARRAAVVALGGSRDPAVVAPVAARLSTAETDPDVRRAAAEALGRIGLPAAVPPLLAALADPEWRVSYQAQAALAQVGQPAQTPLLALLRGDDPLTARYARAALAQMQPPPVQALTGLLGSAAAGDRLNAALALAAIGTPAARQALRAVASDPDARVRAAAGGQR